jgi:hypothetical protein
MISLVTLSDLQELKYIHDSVKNSTSWPQFVSEAQQFDIKNWLGDCLLNELITEATAGTFSAANQTLLDGGTYTYLSNTYMFQGLRNCIAYYAFARFTNRAPFNYTAAGIVVKESDYSTPISDKDRQRLETEARLMGDAIKCEIITYLGRNYTLYPCWSERACGCGASCNDNRPFQVWGE